MYWIRLSLGIGFYIVFNDEKNIFSKPLLISKKLKFRIWISDEKKICQFKMFSCSKSNSHFVFVLVEFSAIPLALIHNRITDQMNEKE